MEERLAHDPEERERWQQRNAKFRHAKAAADSQPSGGASGGPRPGQSAVRAASRPRDTATARGSIASSDDDHSLFARLQTAATLRLG
jgi:hypothetical protein